MIYRNFPTSDQPTSSNIFKIACNHIKHFGPTQFTLTYSKILAPNLATSIDNFRHTLGTKLYKPINQKVPRKPQTSPVMHQRPSQQQNPRHIRQRSTHPFSLVKNSSITIRMAKILSRRTLNSSQTTPQTTPTPSIHFPTPTS